MTNRSYRAKINVFFGVLNKIFNCVLPFFSRTVVLYLLGSQYLGLGTLFTSILSFLSLTELGISSAINYAMYKPLAYGDYTEVGTLLNFYKKIYRIIGFVMLSIGLIIIPLIPYLISGYIPTDINISILYIIYLLSSVCSYFFCGYRTCLLSASQREDIVSKIGIVVLLFNNIGQIVVLCLFKNYYAFAIVPIIGAIVNNVSCTIVSKRLYPEIICQGKIDIKTKKALRKKISGLFGTKLNSVVVHQADALVISSFLGLETLAAYGNYYYIMNAISAFIIVVFTSLTASVGNKLAIDDIEDNYQLFKRISFLNSWMVGIACSCFISIYQPFMKIWTKGKLMLPMGVVVLLVIYFFVYQVQRTILTYKDAAGLWYEDRYRPYVSMICNLALNIFLVKIIGLYGIIISSIIAFLISLPWSNYVLYHFLFNRKSVLNLLEIFKWFFITVLACSLCYLLCSLFAENLIGIILRIFACLLVSNVIFIFVFRNRDEFLFFCKKIIFINK